jgi:hypothetical protein
LRESYRQATYSYSVRDINSNTLEICAKAFRSVHGIGKTRFEKLRKPDVTTPPRDNRGKHGNQSKTPDNVMAQVREHISSFPKQQSHYSRKHNADKSYLHDNLTVRRMWMMYLEKHEPDELAKIRRKESSHCIVKLSLYRSVFDNDFNLQFGKPRSDTCCKCDLLAIQIKEAVARGDNTDQLTNEQEMHHRKAEKAYTTLKELEQEVNASPEVDMYTFDFQQNLPCPALTTSEMFYSRMLWVYNFGVHDMSTDDGIMHLWDETQARRGSSEVCSALKKTITSRYNGAKRLILFSDGCGGQNKNKAMVAFLSELVKDTGYQQVDHMFLVRGHTFLPNDRDFGIIEKYKQKCMPIIPSHYDTIIENARVVQPFKIEHMAGSDVYDYKSLGDNMISKTLKDQNGDVVKLRAVSWFSYGSSIEVMIMIMYAKLAGTYCLAK